MGGCGWISQLLLLLLLGGTVSRHIPNTRGPASALSESGGGWEWEWKLERKPIPRLNLSILCPIQSTPLPAADTQQKRLWQWQTKRSYSQGRRRSTYIQFGTSATEQGASGQGERIKHNSCTYSVNTRNFRYHHHRCCCCCPGQDRFGKVRRSFGALRGQSPTHIEGGVMVGTGTRAQIKHNELRRGRQFGVIERNRNHHHLRREGWVGWLVSQI